MQELTLSKMTTISGGHLSPDCKNALIGAGIASGGLLLSAAGGPITLAFGFAGFIWEVGHNLGAYHGEL